jgi:ADP-ribose pyrophosphatase
VTLRPHPDVEVLSTRTEFRGRFFDVIRQELRLPSGLRQELDLVEHGGATAIVARDSQGRVLLVKQYRAAASDWMLEIPAGRLEAGEDPLVCAQRELEEETGYRADEWKLLRAFLPATGFCSEVIHLFEARGLHAVPGGGATCDDDEELEVLWRTPEELMADDISDGKTLLAAALILRG